MRVTNVPPLDDTDDVLARNQFAFLRLHAKNAGICAPKRIENLLRRAFQRPWREILKEKSFADSPTLV